MYPERQPTARVEREYTRGASQPRMSRESILGWQVPQTAAGLFRRAAGADVRLLHPGVGGGDREDGGGAP
eukprot:4426545-Pyramimonas_sp.AAC.1